MSTESLDLDQLDALASAVTAASDAYDAVKGDDGGRAAIVLSAAHDAFDEGVTADVLLALLARVRVAEQDTARLDWLKQNDANVTRHLSGREWAYRVSVAGFVIGATESIDHRAAIDSAIAATPSPTGGER